MKDALEFLRALAKNNNREWFSEHRDWYHRSREQISRLSMEIEEELRKFDVLETEGTRIYRIYRDVRFSNDKTPYNRHLSISFVRAGIHRRGGYYIKITPGASFLAAGFWGPEPADLLHIRKQISSDASPLRNVVASPEFISYFGKLQGEKVKTSPKGFSKENPEIDLIRHKRFIVTHEFSDKEVLDPDFHVLVADGFQKSLPFLSVMTEYLTTDLNGTPII